MHQRHLVLLLAALLSHGTATFAAGPEDAWREVAPRVAAAKRGERTAAPIPRRYRMFVLDLPALRTHAGAIPPSDRQELHVSQSIIALPMPDGGFERFRIAANAVLPPGLAAKYPEIQTFSGEAVGDSKLKARIDWNGNVLHAMIFRPGAVIYVEPYPDAEGPYHICFYKKDAAELPRDRSAADVIESTSQPPDTRAEARTRTATPEASGEALRLRTYRLAVAATGEYTGFHGGTVALGLAAVATAVNRVSGIYEKELGVSFQLVEDNDRIIYTDAETDPYSNRRAEALLRENQENLDRVIGSGNYDLGHVFNTDGGGLAYLGVLCGADKAKGKTGSRFPTGDAFWVDYVAHEIGHQLGAAHTFNSPLGSCKGQRNPRTAYEIGSGSTIMAYAGLCGRDNLQDHSDTYFHHRSIDQIARHITSRTSGACGLIEHSDNQPPTVMTPAQVFPIPKSTPFELTGAAEDPDGDMLTYAWEEEDLGPARTIQKTQKSAAAARKVPLFRSFAPTDSPQRSVPKVEALLGTEDSIGEILPTSDRTLKFRLTVRDGQGAASSGALTTLQVIAGAGPFQVTEPRSDAIWHPGSQQGLVRWDIAATDQPPVSCRTVNILLSTNDGKDFSVPLVDASPNDGEESVTVPAVTTTKGRVKVACNDNVFFAIGAGVVTIVE